MTVEDEVYAGWLDILGSDIIVSPEELCESLHRLHDAAEASHTYEKGEG